MHLTEYWSRFISEEALEEIEQERSSGLRGKAAGGDIEERSQVGLGLWYS